MVGCRTNWQRLPWDICTSLKNKQNVYTHEYDIKKNKCMCASVRACVRAQKFHFGFKLVRERKTKTLTKTLTLAVPLSIQVQSTLALRTPRYYGHPLLRTKSNPPPGVSYTGLSENDSRYCGLSLLRASNYVPRVSAITRVDYTEALI